MFENLVPSESQGPVISRRAAIGAFGVAGLSAAAIAQLGQPPAAPPPPAPAAQPVTPPTPPVAPTPKQPAPVGPASVTANTDLNGCGFYRFKLGGAGGPTLTLLTDGSMPLSLSMFGGPGNASREDVTAAAADVLIPPAKMLGHVHGLLVDMNGTDAGRVLIDTGCGSGMGPNTGRLPRALALAGFTPAQIGAVVITHAHPDHVGGLMEAGGPNLFANAHFFAAKAEVDFWIGGTPPDLSKTRVPQQMQDAVKMTASTLFSQLTGAEFKGRFHQLGDGDKVLDGVTHNLAPGHTPGHSVVAVASGSEKLIHLTDVAHHAGIQFPHPDWHVAYDTDPVLAAKTRRSLLSTAAGEKTLVTGSHLPFPAVGYVRAEGSGFRWVPRVWEW